MKKIPNPTARRWTRLRRTILRGGALLAVLLPIWSPAQDTLVQTTNYYIVKGSTLREIHHSIRQSRPWKDRNPAEGFTEWQVYWKYEVSGGPDGCRCTVLTTKTTVTITLPRWTPATNPTPNLKAAWTRYLTALARHEAGHAQIAVAAAAEIQRRISVLGPDPNCENLKRRINALGRQILADHRKQEKDYDERTAHGTKDGVSLFGAGPSP